MVRKALLGVLASTLVASVALADDGPVGATVSTTVASMYEWNGFDAVKGSGLDEGPVVQPVVTVGVKNTGLNIVVGGSFVVNDNSQLHETKYGVNVVRAVSPLVDVGAGYNFYDDRVKEDVTGQPRVDNNKHEGWGSLSVKTAAGVTPGVTVKYEKPVQEGLDAFTVVGGNLDYSVPMSGVALGGAGVDVKLHSGVLYQTALKVNDTEVVKAGLSAVQFGVSSAVRTGQVVVTPAVNYQVTLRDVAAGVEEISSENQFWASLGVAYGF
jgi:hypothetical protein